MEKILQGKWEYPWEKLQEKGDSAIFTKKNGGFRGDFMGYHGDIM